VGDIGGVIYSRSFQSVTDFGFQDVPQDQKEELVKEVFSKVARKYDIMNDFMSFGAHRLWKDDLIKMTGIKAAAQNDPVNIPRHLDVAGGTGDIGFRMARELIQEYNIDADGEQKDDFSRQVVICDINAEMLKFGRKKVSTVLGNNASLVTVLPS